MNTTINMYKIHTFLLFVLLNFTFGYSQQYEIGVMAGGSKYIGDIGKEDYFYPSNIGGSLIFKNTVNPWMYLRIGLGYFPVQSFDSQSISIGRQLRNYSFKGDIMELSLGIEYNFLPKNPFLKGRKYNRFTPYMFSGVLISNYFGKIYKNEVDLKDYNGVTLGIPMILGFKYKLAEHLLFTSEIGARYTFSDNLDGTSTYYKNENSNPKKLIRSTNLNSNDWYTFTSFGFIYTFGDLRCYFNF